MASYCLRWNAPKSDFWGSKILVNFWFMSHNFHSQYARKSIKGSIDADFDLVFNSTLSPKNGPLGRLRGPGKDGQNNAKTPLLVTFPPWKAQTQNKHFLFDFDYKTCWIRRGFEQLSSSIAWRVIGLQSSARKVAHLGLKGLKTWYVSCGWYACTAVKPGH